MMRPQPSETQSKWLLFNGILLVSYLGFFHGCLWLGYPLSLWWGLALAAVTTALCIGFRGLFINSYEQFFYFSIPVDIALESFIPLHIGYSFYLCAAAFGLVFLLYRAYLLSAPIKNARGFNSPDVFS